MFTILAMISGVINTVTVMQNGQLTAFYGSYSGTVLIHLTGLLAILLCTAFNRKALPARQKAPLWMYLGGVVGVGTVVFITSAYGGVGVTAITALGLLGQTLTSIFVDHFGLMGSRRSPFFPARCWAVLAVAAGAAVMIFPMGETAPWAVAMAMGSGLTIVCARVLNGQLSQRQGAARATVMNYATGLATSVILMLFLGRGEPLWVSPALSDNWFMYLGGVFGVCLIVLLNVTVPQVPSFAFTLLQFTGQIFTGLLLDTLLEGAFSWQNFFGGVLVAVGLGLDAWLSRRRLAREA